jgi:parvulin-like peptidyl-prolyl isomerase
MLEQSGSPQARQQFLQSWVTQEILYRQALEQQLPEKAGVKKLLNDQARGILSQQVMNQELAAKIHITETDLQMYYSANKSSFVEPVKARISHIVVEDEEQARGLIGRIKDGEGLAELAKEFSTDAATKENGGRIDTEVATGSYVAGIGDMPELNEKIFAADAPTVLEEPFKSDKGWEIIRVDEKRPERQKSFDEVREQVMSTLLSQKREDVQRDYIKEMMDKYNVVIHASALTGAGEGDSEGDWSKQSK